MNMDEKKKILYIIDTEVHMEDFIKQNQYIDLENNIVLECSPVISPFDNSMRSIILTVYQHNIGKIVIVTSKEKNRQKSLSSLVLEENQKKDLQEKIQTLNYLFNYCKPEFPEANVLDWLEGNSSTENMLKVIRQHPLLPSDVQMTELLLDENNKVMGKEKNYQ
ncbi:hypothetical protein ACH0B5_00070 [Ureibacillus sp. 179-F W5.1 NHS]|uniref:Carbonic anhydrase n=1 Tax=Lysinibacillus halotolerans TaxID=1368476 RepID=A0A3M8H6R0_9BACI|nr:hypothetical protein [Lysinibacillus halotolerans]RNC98098.1 hypothetical protein EC501_12405 [Lysinibacillus halotolerans]